MICNVLSGHEEDGTPVNGLFISLTIEDVHQAVEALHQGADIVELPPVNLDGLLSGTGTEGHMNFIRLTVARDEETVHIALAEEMAEAGIEDYYVEGHGDAPEGGISASWVSPLQQDLTAELDSLDSPDSDFWKGV